MTSFHVQIVKSGGTGRISQETVLEAVRSGLKDFITQSAPFCLRYQLHLGNEILISSPLYESLRPLAGEQFRLVLTPSTGAGAVRGTLGN